MKAATSSSVEASMILTVLSAEHLVRVRARIRVRVRVRARVRARGRRQVGLGFGIGLARRRELSTLCRALVLRRQVSEAERRACLLRLVHLGAHLVLGLRSGLGSGLG